jgi:hypothetical protein
MALFPRRVLQRILAENAAFLTAAQANSVCRRLNTVHDGYLALEWEQAVFNAASKVGAVRYEPSVEGHRRPDLLLTCQNPSIEFIADVTAASDKGLHHLNPVDALDEQFRLHLRKRKLLDGGFNVKVDAHPRSVYRGSKETVNLKLPRQSQFPTTIFNAKFHAFLGEVCTSPDQRHEYHAVSRDAGVHFTYDPLKRGFSGGSYASYAVANRIDQNPVYNALKSKGGQLKGTGYAGPCGVFLCDGGCQMLRSKWKNWNEFSTEEVIRHFLRQYDSVGFVATFAVREEEQSAHPRSRRLVEPNLYVNPKWRGELARLELVVSKVYSFLPRPEETPENAMRALKFHKGIWARQWKGGLIVGGNVKMSARMLLELLAGKKSAAEFEQEFGMTATENPFRRMLAQGRLISSIKVEHLPEEDDDVVTVEFGEVDPAVAPFRV